MQETFRFILSPEEQAAPDTRFTLFALELLQAPVGHVVLWGVCRYNFLRCSG